jgi:hypothetical protein
MSWINGQGQYIPGRKPGSRNKSRYAVSERFRRFFEPCPTTGCWLWTGASFGDNGRERGCFNMPRERGTNASRCAWRIYRGEIPAGAHVLHHCDVPLCVNPAHLWLGSHSENMADATRKGRFSRTQML